MGCGGVSGNLGVWVASAAGGCLNGESCVWGDLGICNVGAAMVVFCRGFEIVWAKSRWRDRKRWGECIR